LLATDDGPLARAQGRANPNVADVRKNRPLHKVVENFLLAGKAKDKTTGALISPEDCELKNRYILDVIKVLVKYGATADAKGPRGKKPADIALVKEAYDIAKFLKEAAKTG
jgi:hypothetical protein